MDSYINYNINPLVAHLNKYPEDFTRKDIIKYVTEKGVRVINFRYVAADGRLKSLNFPVTNIKYLENILTYGERVDGSSLFPYISAGSGDLYVVPRFRTAYHDPFSPIPALGMLCSYFTKDGLPLDSSPEYTLRRASESFTAKTGYKFEAMGELEFYTKAADQKMYETPNQRGYHESYPFVKQEGFRCEAMHCIASCGGEIKYAHSEVGNFKREDGAYEQHEIEFLVTSVEKAADQLVLAKWILRSLAYKHGLDITFAPKITEGKAGSGMHFHTRLVKNGKPVMIEDGKLSNQARTAIAGYMDCASSLTAFGNTNPTSYFRLVPHQEAPTSICWGDRNRSVLVRVPLGWTGENDMLHNANPLEPYETNVTAEKQTVELRSPDGSADIYNTLAGLTVAARHGFEIENPLERAAETYVDVNIHDSKNREKMIKLEQLPASCYESALQLEKMRHIYESDGVFSPLLIDGTIDKLKSYNDKELRKETLNNPGLLKELVERYYHC